MIIDRIENKMVICEDENGEMLELFIELFVQPVCDGDVVVKNEKGLYETDKNETEKRKQKSKSQY